jgi:hypothetical protein
MTFWLDPTGGAGDGKVAVGGCLLEKNFLARELGPAGYSFKIKKGDRDQGDCHGGKAGNGSSAAPVGTAHEDGGCEVENEEKDEDLEGGQEIDEEKAEQQAAGNVANDVQHVNFANLGGVFFFAAEA